MVQQIKHNTETVKYYEKNKQQRLYIVKRAGHETNPRFYRGIFYILTSLNRDLNAHYGACCGPTCADDCVVKILLGRLPPPQAAL